MTRATRLGTALLAVPLLAWFSPSEAPAFPPDFQHEWGSRGSGPGEFQNPIGVAVGPDGAVYVTDKENHRVQKFDAAGSHLGDWGTFGIGDGEFNEPFGIAVNANGHVYVTDASDRVQKFSDSGVYLDHWGVSSSSRGIAVDAHGDVYVIGVQTGADLGVVKFDSGGSFLLEWGEFGNGDGEFLSPYGITIDAEGDVWVTDATANQVHEFENDGTFLRRWGQGGSGPGQLDNAFGIAVEADGSVLIADYGHRVQRFSPDGTLLDAWGSQGSAPGEFSFPEGVAVGSDGSIYVADGDNDRIEVFAPSATAVRPARAALRVFSLGANPFDDHARIGFAASAFDELSIEVFDLRGRHLRTLGTALNSESGSVTWDRRDARGSRVAAGVYVVRVTQAGQVQSLKIAAGD